MSDVSSEKYCGLLDELVSDNCNCGYCLLKYLLESIHPDPRFLVQLKCIEKFKYEQSCKDGVDIGWNEACYRWVNKGLAKAFCDAYDGNDDLTVLEIYGNVKKRISSLKNDAPDGLTLMGH